MENKEIQNNKKKDFWGVMLCLSILVLILLVLIIVNSNDTAFLLGR